MEVERLHAELLVVADARRRQHQARKSVGAVGVAAQPHQAFAFVVVAAGRLDDLHGHLGLLPRVGDGAGVVVVLGVGNVLAVPLGQDHAAEGVAAQGVRPLFVLTGAGGGALVAAVGPSLAAGAAI